MDILRGILNDFLVYFSIRTTYGLVRIGVVVLIIVAATVWLSTDDTEVQDESDSVRSVELAQISALNDAGSLTLTGTVAAVDQATIQSERGGRVTNVRVAIGDTVTQGAIIATLENASEQAALLQAEGAYEEAQASAAQSDLNVSSAETAKISAQNDAVTTFRSAYNTSNGIILNQIDEFFSNPNAQSTPGLRLDGFGYTRYLNEERVAFQDILPTWRNEANTLSVDDDLTDSLTTAERRTDRVLEMVDTFIHLLNNQKQPLSYPQSELDSFSSTFSGLRTELNETLRSIERARSALIDAENAIAQAEISGTGGQTSAANARVKQALGSLRSAQANYNDTILRSPISGEVQSKPISTGDVIAPNTTVATITNSDALEITTYINSSQRSRIAVGDTVQIEDEIEGVVTAVAPGIDPATGKIEVKIQSESTELKNGDVVSVSIQTPDEAPENSLGESIIIPITALKVGTERTVVFTVTEENTLTANEVVTGPLLGNSIVIEDGLTADMHIVTDARGLNEGDIVDPVR